MVQHLQVGGDKSITCTHVLYTCTCSTHTSTCTRTCAHVVHIQTHVYMYHTCICSAHVYKHIHVHVYKHIHVHVYKHIHVHVHVCIWSPLLQQLQATNMCRFVVQERSPLHQQRGSSPPCSPPSVQLHSMGVPISSCRKHPQIATQVAPL